MATELGVPAGVDDRDLAAPSRPTIGRSPRELEGLQRVIGARFRIEPPGRQVAGNSPASGGGER